MSIFKEAIMTEGENLLIFNALKIGLKTNPPKVIPTQH
jgi:hypothetical protein